MPKIIVVIGPESSGTRIMSRIIAQHPDIMAHPKIREHYDLLTDVWQGDDTILYHLRKMKYVLTRRSLPHGKPGEAAKYMDFVDLHKFYKLCQGRGLQVILLITTRSPTANFVSWVSTRASVAGSMKKAKRQYRQAYAHIFEFILASNVEYYILSLEALLLDQQAYVQSIYQLLGLPSHHVDMNLQVQVNKSRYRKGD